MNWERIKCAVFGHVWRGEALGDIAAARDCARCSKHWPPVIWERRIRESPTRGNIKPLMAESHRPPPPMPMRKPPRLTEGEWQAEMLTEAKRTNELLKAMSAQGECVRSIPIIPMPSPGR